MPRREMGAADTIRRAAVTRRRLAVQSWGARYRLGPPRVIFPSVYPGATKIEVVRMKPIDPTPLPLRKHRWGLQDAAYGRDLRRALRSMVKTTGLIGRQAGQANSPPACGPAGYLNGVRPGSDLGRQA